MPMPSLFKYFAFVGAALLGLLSFANFLLDPSTGATPVASNPAKPVIVVQHDPRASKIERWRDEQVALKAAQQTKTSGNASLVTKSIAEPVRPATIPATSLAASATVAPVTPQPVQQVATVEAAPVKPQPGAEGAPETPSVAGIQSTDEIAAARAAKAAERKARVAKAKARKERMARTAAQNYASNQQDQYYYGQRGGPQPFAQHYSSAFAPQPSFGPFGSNWGRGW